MISSVTPALTQSDAAANAFSELGSDMFLELLVAQMRNQNPMEPMDSNALLQQTSQLANVEALQGLSDLQSHAVGLGQFGVAAEMIGQEVTVSDPILGVFSGEVTGVRATPAGPMLQIGAIEVTLDQVVSVRSLPTDTTEAGDASTTDDVTVTAPGQVTDELATDAADAAEASDPTDDGAEASDSRDDGIS